MDNPHKESVYYGRAAVELLKQGGFLFAQQAAAPFYDTHP
jgi:hypothetical protein